MWVLFNCREKDFYSKGPKQEPPRLPGPTLLNSAQGGRLQVFLLQGVVLQSGAAPPQEGGIQGYPGLTAGPTAGVQAV